MRIICYDSVLDNRVIDPDDEEEKTAALKANVNFSLISFEELVAGNITSSNL